MGGLGIAIGALVAALLAAGTGAAKYGTDSAANDNYNAQYDRLRARLNGKYSSAQELLDAYKRGEDVTGGYTGRSDMQGVLDYLKTDEERLAYLNNLEKAGQLVYGDSTLGDLFSGYGQSELEALLDEEYGGTKFNLFNADTWAADHNFDWDAFEQDYQNYLDWRDKVGEMPDEVDYDAVANLANAQIDAENAQVSALYDQMLSRSEDSYRNALAENNAMYNDQVNTLLSNSAAETNALAGSMAWQQKRATRNAITRGASAAQRLTASINAQLGTQAQASTQALETSNTLAQMLLSQRQAASSIRQNYNSDLNSYTSNKASLLSGTAERKASYRNSQLSAAESMHQAQMDQWNDRLSAYGGDGAFANAYRKQQQRSQGKSTYTY
jgi:hypothetical protein